MCKTASGIPLNLLEKNGENFAASWKYPIGDRLRVTNLATRRSTTVLIVDKGPAKRLKRNIDLGRKAFEAIASLKKGVIDVSIEEI